MDRFDEPTAGSYFLSQPSSTRPYRSSLTYERLRRLQRASLQSVEVICHQSSRRPVNMVSDVDVFAVVVVPAGVSELLRKTTLLLRA
uniref:Uncharacterized protein n=1 Tax=Anopheles atroparvus TaxID=41427 RepID=A0AAG5DKP3_ANOAO